MIGAFVLNVNHDLHEKWKGNLTEFYNYSIWSEPWIKVGVMQGVALIAITPIALQKDMSKMRFTTIFGIGCLLIVSIVIIIQLPSYLNYYKSLPDTVINVYDLSEGFTKELKFFSGFATIFFSYSCHYGAFPVYNMLANNSPRRIKKVLRRSVILDGCFYLLIGILGYLTIPVDTPNLIITRKSIDDSDIVMTICRLLIAIMLICKIPVNYNSLRISIFNLIYGNTEVTTKR